jgi:hypothetical protein
MGARVWIVFVDFVPRLWGYHITMKKKKKIVCVRMFVCECVFVIGFDVVGVLMEQMSLF